MPRLFAVSFSWQSESYSQAYLIFEDSSVIVRAICTPHHEKSPNNNSVLLLVFLRTQRHPIKMSRAHGAKRRVLFNNSVLISVTALFHSFAGNATKDQVK